MRTLLFSLFILCFGFVANAQVSLTEANNNTVVTIEKGKTLTISLKNNGGTPYQWKMVSNGASALTFNKETTRKEQPQGDMIIVGTPYFTDYQFTAEKVGTSEIQINLVSYSGQISKSMKYTIAVKEASAPINLGEENNGVKLALESAKEAGTIVTVSLVNHAGTPYKWKVTSNNEEVAAFTQEDTRAMNDKLGGDYFTDYKFQITGKKGTTEMQFELTSYSDEIVQIVKYTIIVE